MFKKLLILLLITSFKVQAQSTPNIGFEDGTFNNWELAAGTIDEGGIANVTPTSGIQDRFTIFSKKTDSKVLDEYGKFPVVCPNGSNYSIRLGDLVKSPSRPGNAERITYTFTVPNSESYSIIFNYAVVLQNPSHTASEQPKFTAQVYDITDNKYIDCPSFNFVAGTSLPGFTLSKSLDPKISDVYYKDWSTATIDLHNYTGKQIRLEFTTNDCYPSGHFGYAYIDVGEGLSGLPISGNAYCIGQTSVTLKGPTGFKGYEWFNADLSVSLGTGQNLKIAPAPPDLTKYALKVSPYPDLGACPDTLYTVVNKIDEGFKLQLVDTVHGCKDIGADLTAAAVTAGSSPGMTFSYYLTNEGETDYVHDPTAVLVSGKYYIKGINAEGCTNILPVQVSIGAAEIKVTKRLQYATQQQLI